jgi:hypothetical protein
MVSPKSSHSETLISAKRNLPAEVNSRLEPKTRLRPSQFKYYIHDAVDSCRMQLFGQLSELNIKELNGCWTTARTSLGGRKILLDLRNLTQVDEAGTQWIISMVNDGAVLLPDIFLTQGLTGTVEPIPPTQLRGLLPRILALFRGSRTIPAQSPTQVQ